MLEVRGLSKSFRAAHAIENVDLKVADGEIVAVVGENGAGKTTLLRCLAGALKPTAGSVCFDGEPFDRADMPLRRTIFFLPDVPFIYEDWPILKHLAMVLRLYEAERPGVEEEAIRLLTEFGLLKKVRVAPGGLSRGELYKAGLCGALLSGARHVLLDEPFASGMDPRGIALLKEELTLRAADGHIVVYTTQILDIAEQLSSRVVVLHEGAVEAAGTMAELRDRVATGSGRLEEVFQRLRNPIL